MSLEGPRTTHLKQPIHSSELIWTLSHLTPIILSIPGFLFLSFSLYLQLFITLIDLASEIKSYTLASTLSQDPVSLFTKYPRSCIFPLGGEKGSKVNKNAETFI